MSLAKSQVIEVTTATPMTSPAPTLGPSPLWIASWAPASGSWRPAAMNASISVVVMS